jgi:hypothetical protein
VPAFKGAALCITRQVKALFKPKKRHLGEFLIKKRQKQAFNQYRRTREWL